MPRLCKDHGGRALDHTFCPDCEAELDEEIAERTCPQMATFHVRRTVYGTWKVDARDGGLFLYTAFETTNKLKAEGVCEYLSSGKVNLPKE